MNLLTISINNSTLLLGTLPNSKNSTDQAKKGSWTMLTHSVLWTFCRQTDKSVGYSACVSMSVFQQVNQNILQKWMTYQKEDKMNTSDRRASFYLSFSTFLVNTCFTLQHISVSVLFSYFWLRFSSLTKQILIYLLQLFSYRFLYASFSFRSFLFQRFIKILVFQQQLSLSS